MDTNLKDRLIQERFPTIMAPKYEGLSPCPLHQTRLLITRRGLYIDTLQPFGAFRRCLWFADRDLPYGEVKEVDDFSGILRDPQVTTIFENCVLPQAAEYADDNREWAGWIVWGGTRRSIPPRTNPRTTAKHFRAYRRARRHWA